MHETQTTPRDPYRKFAAGIIARAVMDYTLPQPKNTGFKAYETRLRIWQQEKASAEYFLFKDSELWGTFHMCCALIKMEPNIARADLLRAKEQGPGKLREIIRQIKKSIGNVRKKA